jgi:plasmid stabilization system protein ParE
VPEVGDESIRQRIVHRYRIIFRICESDGRIEVLAVIHGARLLPGDLPVGRHVRP